VDAKSYFLAAACSNVLRPRARGVGPAHQCDFLLLILPGFYFVERNIRFFFLVFVFLPVLLWFGSFLTGFLVVVQKIPFFIFYFLFKKKLNIFKFEFFLLGMFFKYGNFNVNILNMKN
jgi:hypothetical protein